MIAANLAQKSRSETCALTPAMVADDWLFSSSSSVLCPKPATVSATVGSGIVASTGVERWSKSRDSAVVSATARPGQSHRSRQIGVLPRGQQKDGGRSGLVDLSIAKPPVYENRGLAHQMPWHANQAASINRNASFLISHHIKLNPYIAMVTRLAEKNKHSPICCSELVANEDISPELSKVIPSPIPGIAIKQCKKSNFSKSAQSTLNTTDAKTAAGSDVTNKKMIANCDRLRNSGSTACRSTYAQQTTFAINAEMRPAVIKLMVEFPYQRRVLGIAHRSRIAVTAARKEVSNKFYLGNSTTPNLGVRRLS